MSIKHSMTLNKPDTELKSQDNEEFENISIETTTNSKPSLENTNIKKLLSPEPLFSVGLSKSDNIDEEILRETKIITNIKKQVFESNNNFYAPKKLTQAEIECEDINGWDTV